MCYMRRSWKSRMDWPNKKADYPALEDMQFTNFSKMMTMNGERDG